MTRAKLVEALEVERYLPTPPRPQPEPRGWTPEEQAEHRAALLDALSDDPVVVAWRERKAS